MTITDKTFHTTQLSSPLTKLSPTLVVNILECLDIKSLMQFEITCSQTYSLTRHVWKTTNPNEGLKRINNTIIALFNFCPCACSRDYSRLQSLYQAAAFLCSEPKPTTDLSKEEKKLEISLSNIVAENSPSLLDTLPEMVVSILAKLDTQSLLQFERTCSQADAFIQPIWMAKRKQHPFLFNWTFLKDHPKQNKWTCILTDLFNQHFLQLEKLMLQVLHLADPIASAHKIELIHALSEKVKKIHQLSPLIKLFPDWGYLIERDLQLFQKNLLKQINTLSTPSSQNRSCDSQFLPALYQLATSLCWQPNLNPTQVMTTKSKEVGLNSQTWEGGEWLTQGLFLAQFIISNELEENQREKLLAQVHYYLKNAIRKKATLASLLTQTSTLLREKLPLEIHLSLAHEAAKQKDYSGLYGLGFGNHSTCSPFALFDDYPSLSPLWAMRAASWVNCLREGRPLPPSIHIAFLNHLYKHILQDSDFHPPKVWSDMAYIKLKSHEFEQAEDFCTKAIDLYQDENAQVLFTKPNLILISRARCYIELAHIKIHLKQLEEANFLCEKAIILLELSDNPPITTKRYILQQAASLKELLNQPEKAKALHDKAQACKIDETTPVAPFMPLTEEEKKLPFIQKCLNQ